MFFLFIEVIRTDEDWSDILWSGVVPFVVDMSFVLSSEVEFRSPFQFLPIFSTRSTDLVMCKSSVNVRKSVKSQKHQKFAYKHVLPHILVIFVEIEEFLI